MGPALVRKRLLIDVGKQNAPSTRCARLLINQTAAGTCVGCSQQGPTPANAGQLGSSKRDPWQCGVKRIQTLDQRERHRRRGAKTPVRDVAMLVRMHQWARGTTERGTPYRSNRDTGSGARRAGVAGWPASSAQLAAEEPGPPIAICLPFGSCLPWVEVEPRKGFMAWPTPVRWRPLAVPVVGPHRLSDFARNDRRGTPGQAGRIDGPACDSAR